MNAAHTAASDLDTIIATARVCAQGWAQEANDTSARRWDSFTPIPDADIDFVERERLGRPMDDEEAAEFSRVFRDEYAACMAQKAAREGWDDKP